jgi:hypothetical protein
VGILHLRCQTLDGEVVVVGETLVVMGGGRMGLQGLAGDEMCV